MAAVPNLRALVVGPLEAALGDDWTIIGHPDPPARPDESTVAVWTTDIAWLPEAPASTYSATLMVVVFTAHQDARKADDDLDPRLIEVLDILWRAPDVILVSAERVTRGNAPCWDVTVRTAFTPDLTPED